MSEIEAGLNQRDAIARRGRAERLAELMALGEPAEGRMLFGGIECMNALWEARWSYVYSLDLCAILASQICVEKLLAAAVEMQGSVAPNSYAALLTQAAAKGMLVAWEYELFDRLRRARNPHAHHRGVNDPQNLDRRAMETGENTDDLLRADARAALRALLGLLNRPPFGLGLVIGPIFEEELFPAVHPEQMALTESASWPD